MTDDEGTIEKAVRLAVAAARRAGDVIDARDQAVIALATAYARGIDRGELDPHRAGPALLASLEALRLSPRARAAAVKGGTGSDSSPAAAAFDELRARRSRQSAG